MRLKSLRTQHQCLCQQWGLPLSFLFSLSLHSLNGTVALLSLFAFCVVVVLSCALSSLHCVHLLHLVLVLHCQLSCWSSLLVIVIGTLQHNGHLISIHSALFVICLFVYWHIAIQCNSCHHSSMFHSLMSCPHGHDG